MGIRNVFLGPAAASEQLTWLQRKETWRGDLKTNRIRMIALVIFAVNEVVNYSVFHFVDLRFHLGSLLIVFIWLLFAVLFGLALRRHLLPRGSPYLAASVDLLLITWLLFLADGPRSPLVGVYFLIVALSGIRLSPPLTAYTTGAAVFGYLAVLEFVKRKVPQFAVPRPHETIVILCLLFMGAIMTHLVSRVLELLNAQLPAAKDVT